MGYIEKQPHEGIGLYTIIADDNYGYINIGTPINLENKYYRGTLRFELLK